MPQAGRDNTFFVVGIGASAVGLEAVAELLGALPAATGMAFILVQHLDPSHESLLSEILAKKTAIPVTVAHAGEVVRSGHVYVIPADAILSVRDGHIELKRRTSTGERFPPVDVLFKSLAATYADHAIGVVLSGGDSDGSLGIREIKDAGGFTFAQRPESARFPNMPQHAIDTGCVDLVLRPNEIADELVRLSRRLPRGESIAASGSKRATDARIEVEDGQLGHVFRRLSLVRQLLKLHRGEITATSAGLAMGSEFVVTLPVSAANNGDAPGPESPVGTPRPPVKLRTRRVLIVDDHEEVGKSVGRLVRTWGHEVAIVRDGPGALALANSFQPECAIVDLSLPGMSGIELARHLREVFPPRQLYMIALTGYAGAEIREACLAAGFDVHLVKPGEINLLEELLGAERPDSETTSHQ